MFILHIDYDGGLKEKERKIERKIKVIFMKNDLLSVDC